jgi:tetratricopeptide (TPR) repeat protein
MTGKWPTLRGLIRAVRGQAYREMEHDDEALADYDRAIELDPEDASALASRRETYLVPRQETFAPIPEVRRPPR